MDSLNSTEDLFRRSSTAALWSYAGALTKVLIQFVIQIALARILGPQVYGQFAIVLAVLGFGWLMSDGGFGSALIQKHSVSEADVSFAIGWVLTTACLLGSALSLLSPFIATFVSAPQLAGVLWIVGPLVVVQALSNIPLSLMRRKLDAKGVQAIQVGSYAVGFGAVGLPLAYSGMGVWSLIAAFGVQSLLTLLFSYARTRHSLKPSWRGDSGLRAFGLGVMLTNIANWAGDNLDRMVIGKFWGMSQLGAYGAASNLAKTPVGMLVGSIQSVVFASGARLQGDHGRLREAYLASLSALVLASLPLFLVIAFHADFVIQFVYGQRWKEAAPLLRAVSVAVPFLVVVSVTGPILWAIGKVRVELYVQLAVTFLMITVLFGLHSISLVTVVWVIPLAVAFKAALLVRGLAARITLPLRKVFAACSGGILLGMLACSASLLAQGIQALSPGQRLCSVMLLLVLSSVVFRRNLLGRELRELLLRKRSDSAALNAAVGFLGL